MADCILWTGAVTSNGYGSAWDREARKVRSAHRVAWERANGRTIPSGVVVMHSCDNRLCVNPEHLTLGSQSQNILDAIERGRATPGAYNLRKTHCPSGHEYDEKNTHYRKDGSRVCRRCNTIRERNRRANDG